MPGELPQPSGSWTIPQSDFLVAAVKKDPLNRAHYSL